MADGGKRPDQYRRVGSVGAGRKDSDGCRLQTLATAVGLQRALASPTLHAQERALAKAAPKKMKDFGYRPVTVQFLGGLEVEVMARYWCRSQAPADKGKGSYFGLTFLGVCDRTTPALASEVGQLAAAQSSFEDARARLRQMGVEMSIRRIANVAYHFAQRARSRQELDGMGIEGSLARASGPVKSFVSGRECAVRGFALANGLQRGWRSG